MASPEDKSHNPHDYSIGPVIFHDYKDAPTTSNPQRLIPGVGLVPAESGTQLTDESTYTYHRTPITPEGGGDISDVTVLIDKNGVVRVPIEHRDDGTIALVAPVLDLRGPRQ